MADIDVLRIGSRRYCSLRQVHHCLMSLVNLKARRTIHGHDKAPNKPHNSSLFYYISTSVAESMTQFCVLEKQLTA